MTIDAAKMYHLDSRIGSIAPGRDADLVIFSGPPFETGSAVKRVIVGGQEVTK
jgi:imidazolonepropionase-like amidohydrolase